MLGYERLTMMSFVRRIMDTKVFRGGDERIDQAGR